MTPSISDNLPVVIDHVLAHGMVIIQNDDGQACLFVPTEGATPAAINFMATYGGGLICLAMTPERCSALGIELQARATAHDGRPRFGVSIEAREGVTTGISAFDRATTVAAAASGVADDLVSPGHVFPVVAHEHGTLAQLGHVEAAVDLARLADCTAMGVICDILGARGDMASADEIGDLAHMHDLPIIAARAIASQRQNEEAVIWRVADEEIVIGQGAIWRQLRYVSMDGREYGALLHGDMPQRGGIHALWHDFALMDELVGRDTPERPSLRQIMGEASRGGSMLILFDAPGTALQPSASANPMMHDPSLITRKIIADLQDHRPATVVPTRRHSGIAQSAGGRG